MADQSKTIQALTAENTALKERIRKLEATYEGLKSTQETLQENAARYRFLANKMTDVVWIQDLNLRTVYVSPSVEKMLGFTPEERVLQDVTEQLTPASLSSVYDVLAQELALEEQGHTDTEKTITIEVEYYHKDGSTRWGENIVSGIRNDRGELTGIHGVTRDITKRKRIEEELRKKDKTLNAFFDAVQESMVLISPEGIIRLSNRPAAKRLGKTLQEFEGTCLYDHFPPEVASLRKSKYEKVFATGEPICFKDTRAGRTFEQRCYPVFSDDKKVCGVAIFAQDVTELHRAHESLQASKGNFRRSLAESPFGIRIVSQKGKPLYVNTAFLDIFDYESAGEWKTKPSRRYTIKSLDEHRLRKEKRRSGQTEAEEYELEILGKNGTVRHIQVWRKPVLWDGESQYQVLYADITERKRAEEELLRTLERLNKALEATIEIMVQAIEARDPYTAGHQQRVADLAQAIAAEMDLGKDRIAGIYMAGVVHDIGKLSIPAEILAKPSKLSDIEYALIKEHALIGYDILKNMDFPCPLAEVIYQHHERMDGSGYPRNLKGEEILLEARIMAVADVVEAMSSHRPYRAARGIAAALEEIESGRGSLYDDTVVEACLKLFREKGYQLKHV